MGNEQKTIVEQGNATAGNIATNNSEESKDWYAERRSNGFAAHKNQPAMQAEPVEKVVPPNEEAKPDDSKPIEPTDLEKAEHAFKSKFGKEHGKRKEAEEAAERAISEATHYKQKAEELEKALKRFQAETPDRSKFASDAEYNRELSRRDTQSTLAQRDLEMLNNQAGVANQKAFQSQWDGKALSAMERMPDWHEKVAGAKNVPLSERSQIDIMTSDVGAELAYYFAHNPSEAQKLDALDGDARTRFLARIEYKAEQLYGGSSTASAPQTEALPVTPAKPALKPTLSSPSGGAKPANADTMTMEQYAALRRTGKFPH